MFGKEVVRVQALEGKLSPISLQLCGNCGEGYGGGGWGGAEIPSPHVVTGDLRGISPEARKVTPSFR